MSPIKQKLSIEEQLNHMKEKGIQFNYTNEEEALAYLANNTYYFKLKAYAKNYDQYKRGHSKIGKYENLEFAYLQELSIIDMHLRHLIMKMALDIEHAVKVRLLNDFNKSDDDGYQIIAKFNSIYADIEDKIKEKKGNSFCRDLIEKLSISGYAIWNIIEVLSFHDLLKLYYLFYTEYPECLSGKNLFYPLMSVKRLRNAAAHSNCLLNSLKKPYSGEIKQNDKINSFISKITSIDKLSRQNNMSNRLVYDFVTFLYVFDNITISEGIRRHTLEALDGLFNVRMVQNNVYFSQNSSIMSTYIFIKKVVDYLVKKSI